MVLDFGAHLFQERTYPEAFAGSQMESLLGERLSDLETMRLMYERAGIDGAVLSQPYYMGSEDAEVTAKVNEALLDLIEPIEDLYGLAAIPIQAGGEAAASEFQRALESGLNGGCIETKSNGAGLLDSAVRPVFEVADRTGAPLFIHPKLEESLHPEVFDGRFMLNATFGRETALAASICRVIHGGILDEYPNLNLVYHHLGGNIAAMMGRVRLQLDPRRWPGQEWVKSTEGFERQLSERIYVDTAGFFGDERPIRAALDVFNDENVLFGTDYPYEPRSAVELKRFVRAIRRVATTEQADSVLSKNALNVLVNV